MESVSVGLWSVLPPLVAIVLALLTKEVIFSLACGIFSGAVIYAVAANLGVAGVFSSVSDLMIEKWAEMRLCCCLLFCWEPWLR